MGVTPLFPAADAETGLSTGFEAELALGFEGVDIDNELSIAILRVDERKANSGRAFA